MKMKNYYNLTIYRFGSLGHGNEIFTADFQKPESARLTAVGIAHRLLDRKIGLFKDERRFDIVSEGLGHDEMSVRYEDPKTNEVPLCYKFIVTEKPLHAEFVSTDDVLKSAIGLA